MGLSEDSRHRKAWRSEFMSPGILFINPQSKMRGQWGWFRSGKRGPEQPLETFQPSLCSLFSLSTSVAVWAESGKP